MSSYLALSFVLSCSTEYESTSIYKQGLKLEVKQFIYSNFR